MKNYTYFAADGNYGDAADLLLVETDTFTAEDFENIDLRRDDLRLVEAELLANERDRHFGYAIAISDDERAIAIDTLEAVIQHLTTHGFPGWGAELGDIRDILTRGMENQ
jgi:hypothetical protein